MPRQLNLYKTLKKWGLTVEYVPGWSKRGSDYFNPKGVVAHWTAGPRGSETRPSLNICTYGRAGLPGPLCNVYLDRRGVCVIVAAGRANHAGGGSWGGVSGNSGFLGIEAEAADNSDWTDAQREAYPRLCAALLDAIGTRDAGMLCGHSEYAGPRKIDINGYTTRALRADTQTILDGGSIIAHADNTTVTPLPDPEELTVAQYEELKAQQDAIQETLASVVYHLGSLRNTLQGEHVDAVNSKGEKIKTNVIGTLENHDILLRQIKQAVSANG